MRAKRRSSAASSRPAVATCITEAALGANVHISNQGTYRTEKPSFHSPTSSLQGPKGLPRFLATPSEAFTKGCACNTHANSSNREWYQGVPTFQPPSESLPSKSSLLQPSSAAAPPIRSIWRHRADKHPLVCLLNTNTFEGNVFLLSKLVNMEFLKGSEDNT